MTYWVWKNIDSAPHDGSRFLAYVPSRRTGGGHIVIARWYSPEPGDALSKTARINVEKNGGYFCCGHKSPKPMHYCPTHWTPLPPKPE